MRRPLLLTLVLALCAAPALVPATAAARPGQQVTFEAPRELVYEPEKRAEAFSTLESLGVRSLRIVLYWKLVAPSPASRVRPSFDATDPAAYRWGGYDDAIAGARARGWDVLLTLSGPVPRWATQGARDTLTRPRPREFRAFVAAAARHYAGQVRTWSIWNEPNQPQFLKPQFDRRHRPVSPGLYRGLLSAAFEGFHDAGVRRPRVLMGETSPQGTPRVVAPLTFLRGTLCLDSRYKRTRRCARPAVTGYAHHAYTTKAGPFFRPPNPTSVTIGVLGRLTKALDRAAKARALPRHLPIWLTEFGIQSKPDPSYGVGFATQNAYRAISERLAWANRRVVAFSQYLLRDDLPLKRVPRASRYPGFESGLRTSAGKDKPALAGFRLPVSAKRRGSRVSLWGLVRPATARATAVVEVSDRGRRYRRLATVRTTSATSWTKRTTYRKGRRYRVVWTAPGGRTYRSPGVVAYR